ncbi:UNVERIFIED_CONTAM: hypothetical protein Sradi_2122700 [Sesamum radiatum]|uniref:Uncharacterized protein n=1 Tax=Sesamum radiatum TaxID=300843 RepID=A0AAW2TJG3_SESRA
MNLKHGYGVKEFANGDSYEGEWSRGSQEGQGKYQWKNGNCYVGEWKNGKICGKGKMVWTNGNSYDGNWEEDCLRDPGHSNGQMEVSMWGIGVVIQQSRMGLIIPQDHRGKS